MLQFEKFVNDNSVHVEEMHFENFAEFSKAYHTYTTEFTNLQLAMDKADAKCIEEYKNAVTESDKAAVVAIYEGAFDDFVKRAKERVAKIIDAIINFIKSAIDKFKTKLGDWYDKFFNKYYDLLKSNEVNKVKVPWVKIKEHKLDTMDHRFDEPFKYINACYAAKSDEEFNEAFTKAQESIKELGTDIHEISREVRACFKQKEEVEFGKIKAEAIRRANKKIYTGNMETLHMILKSTQAIKDRVDINIKGKLRSMKDQNRVQKILSVLNPIGNLYGEFFYARYKETIGSYMVARQACNIAISALHGKKEQTTESVSLLDQMLAGV
jgi:hypothetical protein